LSPFPCGRRKEVSSLSLPPDIEIRGMIIPGRLKNSIIDLGLYRISMRVKQMALKYVLLRCMFACLIVFAIGCGSASVTKDQGNSDTKRLNVQIEVDTSNVAPGETIRITASVDRIQAESISFNWLNITEWGEITTDTHANSVNWKAPDTIPAGSFKVEVIQVVVTAITHVISTTDDGVDVSTDVISETKTIPITISWSNN
jgi:hypothetical protein